MLLGKELKVNNLIKQRMFILKKLKEKSYFYYEGVLYKENIEYFQNEDIIVVGPRVTEEARIFYTIYIKDVELTPRELMEYSDFSFSKMEDDDLWQHILAAVILYIIVLFIAVLPAGYVISLAWQLFF